jgi:hypothetical protein
VGISTRKRDGCCIPSPPFWNCSSRRKEALINFRFPILKSEPRYLGCYERRRFLRSQTEQFMLIERQNWVCQSGPNLANVLPMLAVEHESQIHGFPNGHN